MTSLRKVLALLAVLTPAAFALPANAANKTFTITPPASLAPGTQTIQVTFTNTGSSNFNSFELDATSAYLQFNTLPAPSIVTPGITGTVSIINATTLQFVNTTPIKKSVTVQVSVTTTGSCGSASATWFAHAWTGSPSSPSETFTLTPLPANTAINLNCTLTFVNQPADALAGSVITTTPFNTPAGQYVKVRLLVNGSPPPTTTANVDSDACFIHGAASTDASGYAEFSTLKSTAAADVSGCILTATASGGYPPATSTPPFKIVHPLGILGCIFTGDDQNNKGGNLDPMADMAYGLPPGETQDWGLIRGPNTDGGPCTEIPYAFTLNPDNTASFIADKLGQKVMVEYVVIWAPVPVDALPAMYPGAGQQKTAGWTQRRPELAWGMGTPGPSDYVPALACVVDDVFSGLAALPFIPDVDPFHGNSHSQYVPGTQAAMCVAQHGWTSVGGGNVQYWSKVIDTDGGVRLP